MIKINNIHQPFLFIKNEEVFIIASEFQNEKLPITFGNDHIYENYWKLKMLNSDFEVSNIKTPETIEYKNKIYYVIQECNPYVYGDKISYVIGGHTKENNSPMLFFLVEGDFDYNTNIVSNVIILQRGRTGFVINDKIFMVNSVETEIILNGIPLFQMKLYLDYIIRIIGIFDDNNKIIVTGKKDNLHKSFLIDLQEQKISKIKNNEDSDVIYKCSILGVDDIGMIAYTNKVFENESRPDYILNIEVGYKLEKI